MFINSQTRFQELNPGPDLTLNLQKGKLQGHVSPTTTSYLTNRIGLDLGNAVRRSVRAPVVEQHPKVALLLGDICDPHTLASQRIRHERRRERPRVALPIQSRLGSQRHHLFFIRASTAQREQRGADLPLRHRAPMVEGRGRGHGGRGRVEAAEEEEQTAYRATASSDTRRPSTVHGCVPSVGIHGAAPVST